MKQILFMCCLFIPFCAFATDMCARDDTMVFILDPIHNGTGDHANSHEWMWWNFFPYGYVSGQATCLSLKEALGQTTCGAYRGKDEYANAFITAESGMYGTDIDGSPRRYCWFRLTHPFLSHWTYNTDYGTAENCKSKCSSNWSDTFNKNPSFRKGLYDSVGR